MNNKSGLLLARDNWKLSMMCECLKFFIVILVLSNLSLSLGWAANDIKGEPDLMAMATPEEIRAYMKQLKKKRTRLKVPGPMSPQMKKLASLKAMLAREGIKQPAPDTRIEVFAAAIVDLKVAGKQGQPGYPNRGKITYPLYQGVLKNSGKKIYFVISDASDQKFAQQYGVMHSGRLEFVDRKAIETTGTSFSIRDGKWVFSQDPGLLPHFDANGKVHPMKVNDDYSPLKLIKWNGRQIVVNMPFVKWGDAPGQQLLMDQGGCNPLLPRVQGCAEKKPMERYLGGQVLEEITILDDQCPYLEPWKPCGWVTMKLHPAIHREDISPYLTIFNASDTVVAELIGVPYTPKLANAGQLNQNLKPGGGSGRNPGLSIIVEFRNGAVMKTGGGPVRFQPGAINYGEQTWSTYSPILHVSWASFVDCSGDVCEEQVKKLSGDPQGIVYFDRLFELWADKKVNIDESPPESMLDEPGKKKAVESGYLLVDAPAPVSVRN